MEDINQIVESDNLEMTYSYIAISDDNNNMFQEISKNYFLVDEEEFEYGIWKYKRIRFRRIDT